MDRYRGDRDRDRDRERDRERDRDRYRDRGRFGASNPDSHHHRRPTRFSDGPPTDNRPSPGSFRSGFSGAPGGGGGQHSFESPPRHHPLPAAGIAGGFGPIGGGGPGGPGGFRPMEGGYNSNFQLPLSGHKRPFPFSGRGDSPDHYDGSSFVKLFVGSVPRTVTEADVRPVFEEHGKVIEVAFIKDKRTGQQQGCCFIKYATSEEADRAIRALHNQYTLPGGVGPIQVRYADGERERLGNDAVEYKLFVGSLNRQATELEVKEIFAPYGRVEDVYLMRDERKQSRGCGFVKFSNRDSAMGAINSLNGIYTMRGCDRPLIVRFAEPKRSGPGEPRPAPGPNISDPMVAQRPRSAWQPITPPSLGPSPDGSFHGFGGQLPPRSGDTALPPTLGGNSGSLGGYPDRLLPGHAVSSSPGSTQGLNHTFSQALPAGQQISPLQKPFQSPQHLPSSLQVQPQGPSSYPQNPSQSSNKQPGEVPSPGGQSSFGHAQPGQQIPSFSGKPPPQLQAQQSCSFAAGQPTRLNSNLRPNIVSTMAQPPHLSASAQQQLPLQQSSSQLAQMLTHQTQALQARFQSSQQAFSQIQQQLQMMQPSGQNQMMQPSGQNQMMQPSGQNPLMGQHQQLQHNFQGTKQQWAGIVPQTPATVPCVTSGTDLASASVGPVAPVTAPTSGSSKCNWTEHTSPDGFKYYYNSASGQSTWVKPEELTLYEQQQQKSLSQQPQTQSNLQAPTAQQVPQTPAMQSQTQFRHRDQIHYPPITSPLQYQTGGALGNNNVNNGQEFKHPSAYPAPGSVNEPARFQQALQGAHDWAWKNKAGGT